MHVSRISVVLNWLNLNLSLAGLSWPIYIGGQVSRIRSGSIQITMSVYDINSYFDYAYDWAYLNGTQGYQDNRLYYLYYHGDDYPGRPRAEPTVS
jgi:hypothetical protein